MMLYQYVTRERFLRLTPNIILHELIEYSGIMGMTR